MARIAVLGAGMMGSALCVPLADSGHDVRLIGTPLDDSIVEALQRGERHPTLGQELPGGVRVFRVSELAAAASEAEGFVLGVSSAGVRWAGGALWPFLERVPRPVLMLSKGLELGPGGMDVLTDAFERACGDVSRARALPHRPVAVCGPCIAGELARRVPTLVVFTSRDLAQARRFAEWFTAPYYHVLVHSDVVGAQVCAALKNAFAMGVALGAGLHERARGERGSVAMHNYEAAVFGQAVIEMQTLVTRLGGAAATAAGFAGSGDLMVTCNGGRTGRFGALLGKGHDSREAVALMRGATLECLEVLDALERYLSSVEATALRRELPLLSHLIEIGLRGAPLDMPFGEFLRA